jgi:acyl carrier protein
MEKKRIDELLIPLIEQETGQSVTEETSLSEMGLDSLEFVSLLQAISEKIQAIPETHWPMLNTVGDIAKVLE